MRATKHSCCLKQQHGLEGLTETTRTLVWSCSNTEHLPKVILRIASCPYYEQVRQATPHRRTLGFEPAAGTPSRRPTGRRPRHSRRPKQPGVMLQVTRPTLASSLETAAPSLVLERRIAGLGLGLKPRSPVRSLLARSSGSLGGGCSGGETWTLSAEPARVFSASHTDHTCVPRACSHPDHMRRSAWSLLSPSMHPTLSSQ